MRDFPMSLTLNSGRVSAIDDRHRNDGLYALIAIEVAREQGWDHESSPVTGLSLTDVRDCQNRTRQRTEIDLTRSSNHEELNALFAGQFFLSLLSAEPREAPADALYHVYSTTRVTAYVSEYSLIMSKITKAISTIVDNEGM
ncbi:hypothetical protein EAG_12517 [Camponotus floridanus]|uniref:Uncharacterized protein n=1 Tax=Camponotus floridanus TaxID=104421 RepID=E1ZVR2_CAMFO|nr:hypothetical protein EAG_12517 [Camponotus floridanus]